MEYQHLNPTEAAEWKQYNHDKEQLRQRVLKDIPNEKKDDRLIESGVEG